MEIKSIRKEPIRIYDFIKENNMGALIKILDRLGRIDSEFDKKPLIQLLIIKMKE